MPEAGVDDVTNEIVAQDSWTVIASYFEKHGLVRQQLDSFNEFVTNTIQSVVSESFPIEVFDEPKRDAAEEGIDEPTVRTKTRLEFGQV